MGGYVPVNVGRPTLGNPTGGSVGRTRPSVKASKLYKQFYG
jgi:hypothetical protein